MSYKLLQFGSVWAKAAIFIVYDVDSGQWLNANTGNAKAKLSMRKQIHLN